MPDERPQPIKCFTQRSTLTGARERIANKVYIRAADYPNVMFDQGLAAAREKGWRTYEVPCGHDVMIDKPERLAERTPATRWKAPTDLFQQRLRDHAVHALGLLTVWVTRRSAARLHSV